MIFWIISGLLALAALAAVVLPVLRARAAARRTADYDIAVYRDQLAEVERNRKRGQIGAAEADAAKAEIGRRILEADQRRERAEAAGANTPRWVVRGAAALVGVAVPLGALALYLQVGNPGMQAMPLAERDVAGDTRTARAGQSGQSAPAGQAGQAQGGAQAGSLAEAEKRLAQRLQERPGDTDGWILLGRTRLSMGKYEAAVRAFQQAIDQEPQSPRVNAMYGEALVMANQGTVVPKAQEAFRAVLAQLPDDPRSRFYLGLAAQQAGEPEKALQRWRGLVADAPADAPYLEPVAQRMAAVERELGIEPGSTFAEVEPEGDGGQERAEAGSAGAAGSGPTREQMQAAQEMSPEARQQMIENMVKGLRARLAENPNDAQGWQRLVRSYAVLGRRQDAREALASALDTFRDAPAVRRRLIAEARRQDVPLPDGVGPTARAGEGAPDEGGGASGRGEGTNGGPTREQMRAAEEMAPEERRAMVESMVQRLADRLEDNPDNLQGWLQLARSYETLDRPEKAVEAYAKAAELAPQDAGVLARYARAIRARDGRQTEKSIALSRRVLEIDPENPEALWFTAMAELGEGDRAKARELFDRAIAQLPPDTPQTAELRKRADEMLQDQQ